MLAATPALAWMFLGIGLPWALVLLPRKDWSDRPLVACLTLALGPALLTAWMFVLGTLGTEANPSLRLDLILVGSAILAGIGAVLARRKRRDEVDHTAAHSLAADEKLLLILIGVALVIRWFVVAYWPFTAYDALWVYGYEGRLYTLVGHIPTSIDYYPQFLPLQYTYLQLATGGAIDDHAARAVLPFLHLGSILAVYVLGARLFDRRTGIIAATLWGLYPHVAEWSRFGDLEIPLTFLLTGAAAFFLMAWTKEAHKRHYAVIAGLLLGIALWTKPTAGALIWGVVLLLAAEVIRVRFHWRAWLPRLEVAAITGLAAAPLGGMWYVRNALLGHLPLVFPPGFWLTQAARSGPEFGWPLLALLTLLAYLYLGPHRVRPDGRQVLAGLMLVLAGLLPSIVAEWLQSLGLPPIVESHRMGAWEWLALGAGTTLLTIALLDYARAQWSGETRSLVQKTGWALLLAAPYFVTWFYSYSYHYRLSFPIVPLMLLPTAVVLSRWLCAWRIAGWTGVRRLAYLAIITLVGLPGVFIALYDTNAGWDWLWTDKLPDDTARYRSGNEALMAVVDGLRIYQNQQDTPLVVVAPGVDRLPFFFPLEDIRVDDVPTRFADLNGVVYFIYGAPESRGVYEGIPITENQVLGALGRKEIVRRAWWRDDGIFNYEVYELHLENRFVEPYAYNAPQEDVVFGDFARFLGHDIGGDYFWLGRKLILHLYWQVLAPIPDGYMIYIHLRDRDGNLWVAWDGPVAKSADGQRYYSTLVWEPGEYLVDERLLEMNNPETPVGEGYTIVIGMYSLQTNERVPVTIGGEPAGDGYTLNERIRIVAEADG